MDHYLRLVVFAVEGCPKPLVELFLKKARADTRPGVPYSTINTFLQHHQPIIQNMLKRKFIHAGQLPLVLPSPSDPPVDITKWDISLVTTMLQNIFQPLSALEQQYIGDIRSVRNELHHHSGTAELDYSDFTSKWNTLETAITGLAQCVSTNFYNEMTRYITELKKKSLPPPGPALDILKQWYNSDKELHQDTKLTMTASKGAHSILNAVVVRSKNHSGAVSKKIKAVDPVVENMKEQFKITMKRYKIEVCPLPNEVEDIRSKLRRYHRVVITGKGNLESALKVIQDEGIRHDRCVQVTEPDESRHVYCDDVDLVLCINPFGKDIYDENKATEMTKHFNKMLENTNLAEKDGRIDVMIVSEIAPFHEYCKLHDHDLLDQVVALNKPTTEAEPIQVSDCVMRTTTQPEPILQNMIGHSALYLEQCRGHQIGEIVSTRVKRLYKQHKAITITGPTHVKKELLAARLMSEYRPEECLVLTKPGDWKYVKLGKVSVILINYFTGKFKCDPEFYTKWLRIFDMIHAAVKGGKLNVILTSHTAFLQEVSQLGTHDLLEQRIELTDEDVVKTSIKTENDAPEACTSSHDTKTVIESPYSYIKENCLTYLGRYTPQLDDEGTKHGNVVSFCTLADGTFLMIKNKATKVNLYHLDSAYKHINKLTLNTRDSESIVMGLNNHEAAVYTYNPHKLYIVSLYDKMSVTRILDISTPCSRTVIAYMDENFFIPSDSGNTIDVYSITGTKVRTIEYEFRAIQKVHGIALSEDRIVLTVKDTESNLHFLFLNMTGDTVCLRKVSEETQVLIRLRMDENCNIYYILKCSEIHRLSASGQCDEVLLKYPRTFVAGLSIDVERHVLYLREFGKDWMDAYTFCT